MEIKAILFDVFGTVVDWHRSITAELKASEKFRNINHSEFANDWRNGYLTGTKKIHVERLPLIKVDTMHMEILTQLISDYKVPSLTKKEIENLNNIWHRLNPWEDSVEGIKILKKNFIVGTLSNGNLSLLVDMAKHAKLEWDCILSAEFFNDFKPGKRVYIGATNLLDLNPNEVMLVAAHKFDLLAAKSHGLKTTYIYRPMEFGEDGEEKFEEDKRFNYSCCSLLELAEKLY